MKRKFVSMLELNKIDNKVQTTLSFAKVAKTAPTVAASEVVPPVAASAFTASEVAASEVVPPVVLKPACVTPAVAHSLSPQSTQPKPELSMIEATSVQMGGGSSSGVVVSSSSIQKPWNTYVDKVIGHAQAVKQIKEWVVAEPRTPLIICGHVGCGKTSLARAALKVCKLPDIWDARMAFDKAPNDTCAATLKIFLETVDAESCGMLLDELDTMEGTDRGNMLKLLKTVNFATAPRLCITVGDEDYKLLTAIQNATKATTIKLWRPRDMSDMHALAAHVLKRHGAVLSPGTVQSIVECCNGDRRKLINMLEWECRTGQDVASTKRTGTYDAFESPWTEATAVFQGCTRETMIDSFLSPLLLLENYPKCTVDIHACANMACAMSDAVETNYDAVPVSEHFMLRAVAHYSAKRAPQLSFPKGASLMASSAKHRATVRNVVKRTRMSVDVSDIDLAFSILTANVPATGKKRGDMLRERGITADEVKYIKSRLPLQL